MEGGARAVSDLLVARQIATGRLDGGKDAAAEMSRDGQPPAIMLLMGGGRHLPTPSPSPSPSPTPTPTPMCRHLGEARKLINVLRQLYRVGVRTSELTPWRAHNEAMRIAILRAKSRAMTRVLRPP